MYIHTCQPFMTKKVYFITLLLDNQFMDIEKIKLHMKLNKITYKQLSEKSGVSENTLKCIFSGRTPAPRIDTMNAILRALDLAPNEEETPNKLLMKLAEQNIYKNDLNKLPDDKIKIIVDLTKNIVADNKKQKSQTNGEAKFRIQVAANSTDDQPIKTIEMTEEQYNRLAKLSEELPNELEIKRQNDELDK